MKLLRLKLLGFVGQLCCPTFGLVCGPSGPVLHHAAVKVLALAPLLLKAGVGGTRAGPAAAVATTAIQAPPFLLQLLQLPAPVLSLEQPEVPLLEPVANKPPFQYQY